MKLFSLKLAVHSIGIQLRVLSGYARDCDLLAARIPIPTSGTPACFRSH